MKKTLALIPALVMLLTLSAYAESVEAAFPYDTVEAAAADTAGWNTVNIADISFSVPADMSEREPNTSNCEIWVAAGSDLLLYVFDITDEYASVEEIDAEYTAGGFDVYTGPFAIGIDNRAYVDPDDDSVCCLLLMTEEGRYYLLMGMSIGDAGMDNFTAIAGTISAN